MVHTDGSPAVTPGGVRGCENVPEGYTRFFVDHGKTAEKPLDIVVPVVDGAGKVLVAICSRHEIVPAPEVGAREHLKVNSRPLVVESLLLR